jgi:hypothetical protein
MKITLRRLLGSLLVILVLIVTVGPGVVHANTTDSATYGSGGYGNCSYGSCTITLTSGGTTNVDVVPNTSGKCTVQSDIASVLTDNPTGYSLTMTTSTTNNVMAGSSGNIASSSATAASPTILAMNTWGYRVDGLAGFGAGPTSILNSGSVPSTTFAKVPPSNLAGTQVASSASAANPAVNTTVWYGVCANSTVPAGSYTVTVTYTAVTN